MDKRVKITNIEIITSKKTKVLSENEIQQFCEKKLRINITESVDDIRKNVCTKTCRVVLERMSSTFIQRALNGKNSRNEKENKDQEISKVN